MNTTHQKRKPNSQKKEPQKGNPVFAPIPKAKWREHATLPFRTLEKSTTKLAESYPLTFALFDIGASWLGNLANRSFLMSHKEKNPMNRYQSKNKQNKSKTMQFRSKYGIKSVPFIAALLLLGISPVLPQALAAAERSESSAGVGYLGLLAGGNNSAQSKESATPTFGVTVGAKLVPAFGVGFLGSYHGQTSSGSLLGLPTGASTKTIILAGQGNYFVGGLHLGGEVGTAITSWSGSVSNIHSGNSETSLIFGPEAGYDFVINRSVSLGAEGHYLIDTAEGGVNNFQVFAALKFWQ